MMSDFRTIRRYDDLFFIRWQGKWIVREASTSKFNSGDRVEMKNLPNGKVLLTKYIGTPPGGRIESEEFNTRTLSDAQVKRIAKVKSNRKVIYRTM